MRRLLPSLLLALLACSEPPAPKTPTAVEAADTIELVESVPLESTLDHVDVRDAAVVWPEMIDRAKATIDLEQFYASDADDGSATPLGNVIAALKRATKRGVKVRFLADKGMSAKYPAALDRLGKIGATVKTIDCAPRYGGVQHAKFFVVDGKESFIGSQNFDWRALSHIQEMGLRMQSPAIAGALADVFATDWALADAGTPAETRTKAHPTFTSKAASGESFALYESPRGWLTNESRWDLDGIVRLLDGAKTSFDLQVMTYSTTNRDKTPFTTLDEAIRRAAGRGVKVRLLVAHWGAKGGAPRAAIEALSAVPNIEVRVLTVPPASSGDIPFARVSHAKFFVVDGARAWVGTSNWEGDYFLKTRNVAIVTEGGALGPRLERVFEDDWKSSYTAPLTRGGAAAPPPSGTGPAPR